MRHERTAVTYFAALAVVGLLSCSPVHAAQGNCSQPVSTGAQPTASDCLFVLRVGVGAETCDRTCVCDTNGVGGTTASDALLCLKRAVGQDVRLNCRCPVDPVGDELQANTFTTGNQLQPAIAEDAQGNFVVAWQSDGTESDSSGFGIRAQRFQITGEAAGTEFQVNTSTTGDQSSVAVAADPDGSFVAVWDGSGAGVGDTTAGVRAQRFDANGTPVGTEFEVNTYTTADQGSASVAVDPESGNFVVVWQSYGSSGTDTSNFSIQGQRYDRGGNPAGTEFQVNTLTPDSQLAPVVTYRGAGRFVVLWTTLAGSGTDPDANVRGQMFVANGDRDSTEFRLNSYTTGTQSNPAVAPDGAGGFFVVWQSAGSATDTDVGIAGRHFGTTGTPGSEVAVNSFTTGSQTDPRVVQLDEARFVVVWQSAGSSAGDADNSIQGQVFGNDDVAIGTEFQVNAYTTGDQVLPDVAAEPGGDFLVVWESQGSAGTDSSGSSIQGQRFE